MNVAQLTEGGLFAQLQAFLLSCKVDGLSPKTLEDYEQKIGAFVRHCSEHKVKQPEDVTVNHIRLFQLTLQERKCKPITVHDYYGCIKRFFNWMVAEGVLSKNPMERTHPPRVPYELITPFSLEQVRELLLSFNENTFLGARNRAIILTFLDTGLRLKELAQLQIKDLDYEKGLIRVMGKGSKERVVGMGTQAQKAMLHYLLMRKDRQPCLWVTDEFSPMKAAGIQTMIRRLGKRLKIQGVRCSPHTFRHTFGTLAMLAGASEREVQLLLGHSTDRMTKKYTATVTSEDIIRRYRRFSPGDKIQLK